MGTAGFGPDEHNLSRDVAEGLWLPVHPPGSWPIDHVHDRSGRELTLRASARNGHPPMLIAALLRQAVPVLLGAGGGPGVD